MTFTERTISFSFILFFTTLFLFTIHTENANGADFRDKANTKDHPLISRYPGFIIKEQAQFEYDQAKLVIGKYDAKKESALLALTPFLPHKVTEITKENQPIVVLNWLTQNKIKICQARLNTLPKPRQSSVLLLNLND